MTHTNNVKQIISRILKDKLIVVFVILFPIILCGMSTFVRPNRYLFMIPKDFVGTVYLQFNVKNAPALKLENGFFVVKFPESGILYTSSEPKPGQYHDEYWVYSGDEKYRLPPEKIGGGGTKAYVNKAGERIMMTYFTVLK